MHIATGIDLVNISKFKERIANKETAKKLFTQEEYADGNSERLAGVFAAKEAFFKAVGINPQWLDVTITKDDRGKPTLSMTDQLKERIISHALSITHEGDLAAASVMLILQKIDK